MRAWSALSSFSLSRRKDSSNSDSWIKLSFALWSSLGPEVTKEHFLWPAADGGGDDTHLQARGAIEVARLLVAAGRMLPGRDQSALADRTLSGDLLVRPPTRPGPDPL